MHYCLDLLIIGQTITVNNYAEADYWSQILFDATAQWQTPFEAIIID